MTVEIDPEAAEGSARVLDRAAGAAEQAAEELVGVGRQTQLDDLCAPLARRSRDSGDLLERTATVLRVRAALARAADVGTPFGLFGADGFDLMAALAGYQGHGGASSVLADVEAWIEDLLGDGGAAVDNFFEWLDGVFEPADPSDPGVAGGPHFVLGDPTRPYIRWDEDFEYDSASPGWRDYLSRAEWQGKLAGGRLLRGDLDDATQMYRHYWDNNGEPIEFDYEEASREDVGVERSIDLEVGRAVEWAETFASDGHTEFSMTGDASAAAEYPHTENWAKAIGGHQLWSSADVRVDGDTIEMTITVHAEDYYNFNRGQSDIATGTSDDENGRFTELGWAQPFPSSGSVERTINWEIGSIEDLEITDMGEPERNPGREDNEIERDAGGPDRTSVPDNDRDTGGPRVDG